MKVSVTVLKVLTVWPALLLSSVLMAVPVALAPPGLALPIFLVATMSLAALAVGRLEVGAVQLLTGSRRASEGELQVVAAVQGGLSAIGVQRPDVHVRRRQHPSTPAAVVIGRRSLVVTPGLVEGLYCGWVRTDEVVALVGQAVGAHRARGSRCEVAVMAATTPSRGLLAVLRGAGAAFAWLPLMRSAWALRGVVALVCVAQSLNEGRTAAGLLGGAVIGLTYAVPAADRALARRTEDAGDRFMAARGLGGVLLGLLDRCGHSVPLERRQRLLEVVTVSDSPARPTLHLVPS